jgi:hypothetical protein
LEEEEDDFDEEIQDLTFAKVKFQLSAIKEAVEEVFDDSRHLQYYDKKQWRPLNDLNSVILQQYRGGKKALRVRVPEHYDDTPIGSDDNDAEVDETFNRFNLDTDSDDDDDEDNPGARRKRRQKKKLIRDPDDDDVPIDIAAIYLETVIKGLVSKLKEEKYVRCDGAIYGENNVKIIIYSMLHTETNEKIRTKDYVLQQASRSKDMSRMLLALPGALDHIVKCIHYDLMWEHEKRPKRLHNGYRRW